MFSIINTLLFFMFSSLQLSNSYLKIAHRGYSELYGDNNLLSFKKAIENNFDVIEMDIQLSKNNEIVLYHDTHIDNILIKDINTKTLVDKHNIITLDYFFQNFDYCYTKINFDLKGNDEKLSSKLVCSLKKYNVNTSLIYVSSFNRNILNELIKYKYNNKMKYYIGFITCNDFTEYELNILLNNIDFFVMDYTILNKKIIDYCHNKNIKVFTYTNKNIYTLDMINKFNVDGVFSDCKFPDINQI